MNLDLLPSLRTSAAKVLGQPTDVLDAPALYRVVEAGIAEQRALRKAAHGAASTLALNALLDLEQQMRTKVFGVPRETIKPAF